MMTDNQIREALTQNMRDAGCNEEMITCLLFCLSNGDKAESLARLKEWREKLLGDIHKDRSCMEDLDQLLSELRVERK